MPRDGSGVYSAPPGTTATPETTILSTPYNAFVADLVADANASRPITAGGTGATNAADARDNLGAPASTDTVLRDGSQSMTDDLPLDGNGLVDVAALNGGPLGGFRNKIINGNFDIWQRGSSLTASAATRYLADRWRTVAAGSTIAPSRQAFTLGQTDVPGNPTYYHRNVVVSSAGSANAALQTQPIESVSGLAGKTATLTFYAKADAAKNIAVEFSQNFGTGGSPSTAVTAIGSQLVALTTAWTRHDVVVNLPSIAGKTLGTDGNDTTQITFWFDAGSSFATRAANLGQQSGTFDLARVSIVEGDASEEDDPFSPRPIQQEEDLCLRFYEKSFPRATAPAQNVGTSGAIALNAVNGGFPQTRVTFKALKRASPTVTTYNPSAANANWRNIDTSADITAGVGEVGDVGFLVSATNSGITNGNLLRLHWTADAEL